MKKNQLKHIKFKNQKNKNAQFDILKLEELYRRTDLDHSIEEYHKVEFYIILFIKKGKGQHAIDNKDYECKKGTLLTIRKDQIQKFTKSKNLEGSLLLFTNEFLISYLEKTEAQKIVLLFNDLLSVPKLQLEGMNFDKIYHHIKRIENEYFIINDEYSLSVIRNELHILTTQLLRIKSVGQHTVLDKKYLKEFLKFQSLVEEKANKTLKVKDFAREMNISTKTLNVVTQKIINKSAKQFIDEIGTKQMKRLLLNTNLSIKEIAYQSGFEETTNFYKYFKRQTQSTPEQFRLAN